MPTVRELTKARKDVVFICPDEIQVDENWNVRDETEKLEEHIRELADSIKEVGVKQPLTVYMRKQGKESHPVLTDGHCRLRAVMLAIHEGAEIKTVPVVMEERFSNEADRTLSLVVRNSGKPLSEPEKARVVKRLLDFGWTKKEIREKTGFSPQRMGSLLSYLSAPVEVQKMINEGKVSYTEAVLTVRKEGEEAVETLGKAVDKAKKHGKKRATARHIGKKDIVLPVENYAKMNIVYDDERLNRIIELCGELRGLLGIEKEEKEELGKSLPLPGVNLSNS